MKNIYQNTYLKLINEWNQQLIYQSRKENYTLQLRKLNLSQQQLNNLLNLILSFNNTKKQLMAIKWLKNGSIILPEDQYKLDEALKLAQKYKLDYQQFSSPMQLINSVQKQEQKYEAQHNIIDPDDVPQFSNKVQHGDGIVTYWVEDTKAGQKAVRKMIDQYWGYDANPWCLAARPIRANQITINNMTQQQKQNLGLYDNDVLATAWTYWKQYSAFPKRIAFKTGKLYAFSANNKNIIIWWDRNDKKYKNFPNSTIIDKDQKIIQQINNIKLSSRKNISKQLIQKFANSQILSIRRNIAARNNLPENIIQKLTNDQDQRVRNYISQQYNLPENIIQKLANDQDQRVRCHIAARNNLPENIIQKLANDDSGFVREYIAEQKNLPENIIQKLANDQDQNVRRYIAARNNLPENIIQKLVNDDSWLVRKSIAEQKNLPENIIQKLANDQNQNIREYIAKQNNLSENIIQKLVNDDLWFVRESIAARNNLPENIIQKLANDQNSNVRESIADRNDLPKHIIQILANDSDGTVRSHIADRNDLPKHIIQILANDQNSNVRTHIAHRNDLPKHIIQKLAHDQNFYVKYAIQHHYKL